MSNHVRGAPTTNRSDPNTTGRRKLAREHRLSGPLPLLFVITLIFAGGAGLAGWPIGPGAVLASTGRSYGPGIGADSLANTQVGGSGCRCSNSTTSYRFRAMTSSSLTSVRIYLMSGSGYSDGSGGTLSISVQTDNGSASHAPSGTVLASTTIGPGNPISIGYLPLVSFSSPARLTAGRLYHLVFRNVDPSPTVNFVSVNALFTRAGTTPRQPGLSDLDWAQLLNDGHGWTVQRNYTPIMDLGYANGVHAGMGYMEVWVAAPKRISGGSAVREYFIPKADHAVSSASVRVSQISGSSPLTIQLETAGGSVLATGSISAAAIGSSPAWVTASLSRSVTLKRGSGYQLVLSAPSGSAYSAFAVERGNNYRFAAATYFTDGYAQYTTGSGWHGFTDGSGRPATNADLQFIFHSTIPAPPTRKPPKKPTAAPRSTRPPASAIPKSALPIATGSPAVSVAPASLDPDASSVVALVPTPEPSSPVVHESSADAASSGLHPGAVLLVAGLAVVLLGSLGVALRRRVRS